MDILFTLRRLRFILAPVGSRQERVYHFLRLFLLMWKQEGLRVALKRVFWKIVGVLRGELVTRDISAMTFTYPEWIREHEPGFRALRKQRRREKSFAYRPLISIITPVYNPSPPVLRDTIQSVVAQTYTHWELCLANGGQEPGAKAVLDEFAQKDRRIRVTHLEANLGIAGNTNEALEMSQGEFIATFQLK